MCQKPDADLVTPCTCSEPGKNKIKLYSLNVGLQNPELMTVEYLNKAKFS